MKFVKYFFKVLILSSLYFVTAKLGLSLDAVSGFATLVWPPTGIALAALLLFGYELWPSVFIGAFFTNFTIKASVLVCFGIATGNTLEALFAFFLLTKISKFHNSLNRIQDILSLIVFAGVWSTLVSAAIGTFSLLAGGVISTSAIAPTLGAWWMGDFLGNLVVTPVLLAWFGRPFSSMSAARIFEAFSLTLFIFILCLLIGGIFPLPLITLYPITYLIFPAVIWACLRFGLRGAATAVFYISIVAILGTTFHLGPFYVGSLSVSLTYLQMFIGTLAITSLILAATFEASQIASQAKSSFLATVSHEIRTPLNAILGFVEILQEQQLPEKDRINYIEIIQKNGQQLSKLLDETLDLSKIEAGKFEIEKTKFSLKNLVSEVLSLLDLNAQAKNLALNVQYDNNAPNEIYSDITKVRQILLNVVGNAIKFTEKGHVNLTIKLIENEKRKFIAFIVKDTGIGISPEQKEKLFHPFSQADSTMTRRYGGTGLGLYISKNMTKILGGDLVLLKNEYDTLGSTFMITIAI